MRNKHCQSTENISKYTLVTKSQNRRKEIIVACLCISLAIQHMFRQMFHLDLGEIKNWHLSYFAMKPSPPYVDRVTEVASTSCHRHPLKPTSRGRPQSDGHQDWTAREKQNHTAGEATYTLVSFILVYQLYSCIGYTLVSFILSYQLYSHIIYWLYSSTSVRRTL